MTDERLALLIQRLDEIHPAARDVARELATELHDERKRNALAVEVAEAIRALDLRIESYASRREAVGLMRRFVDVFAPDPDAAEPRWRSLRGVGTHGTPDPHTEAAPAPHAHQ
jgi:hypothetical protein